jgi:FecR protein
MHSLVRQLVAPLLALAALCASPAALALDTGNIVVTSVKGEVHVTMNGAERDVRAGAVLELPASIRTGRDGAIDLAQGATTVSVGPDSLLEFPALAKRGGSIDRIVQPSGNAFYSIGKRAGHRLRVETPYLVAVIKGTQFNVASLESSTTISLFEGLLEVRASDDSSVVDLNAGEIAARSRGDKSISVIKMDRKTPPSQRSPAGASTDRGGTPSTAASSPNSDVNDGVLADRGVIDPTDTVDNVRGASADGAVTGNNVVTVGSNAVDVNTNVNVDAGAGSVGVAANTNVDLPVAAVDVGASSNVDLGAGAVSLGAAANLDTGSSGAAVNTGVAVDAGAANVAANVDVGANVGAVVDTAANAAVSVGATNVEVTAAVDVGANVAGVAADVNASADVGAGNVNLGVTVAGVDLGVGLDLGLDDGNNGHGNDDDHSDDSNPGHGKNSAPTTPVIDVGGLLDDIVHPRHKK